MSNLGRLCLKVVSRSGFGRVRIAVSAVLRRTFPAGMLLALVTPPALVSADDWPQWRGPRRDAVSAETGLLQSWPTGGPRVAWQASGFGTGYSSVVVGRGRLFTMGRRESDVVVTALDAVTGKSVWTRKIGETSRHPCSTPTLDGDHLYALDPDGDLVCLQAATGEIVWQTSFIDNFAGRMMSGSRLLLL